MDFDISRPPTPDPAARTGFLRGSCRRRRLMRGLSSIILHPCKLPSPVQRGSKGPVPLGRRGGVPRGTACVLICRNGEYPRQRKYPQIPAKRPFQTEAFASV